MSIEYKPVKSSNLSSVGKEGGDLYIKFNGGQHWKYPGAASHYDALIGADSPGRHFSQNIRAQYKGEKLA